MLNKKATRKLLKATRAQLSAEAVREKSEAIFRHWESGFSLSAVKSLHCFLSIPEKQEVDTMPVRDYLYQQKPVIRLVIPLMVPGDELRHVHLSNDIVLEKNKWGIPEPKTPTSFVSPREIDMVLVPMLGFDSHGQRIGYGKGYYDRFLAQTRQDCLKIGLCFELGRLTETLEAESHDIPLDHVVTETGITSFQPQPSSDEQPA